jgi:oxygen-independent coproporphyrinogen-3 oxidase
MDTQALQLSEFDLDLKNKGVIWSWIASVDLSDPDGFLLFNESISLPFGIIYGLTFPFHMFYII